MKTPSTQRQGFVFLALLLSSSLSFFSWILSRTEIAPSESTYTWALNLPSVAKAGFPIQAFELPQPPLGSDVIPDAMLKGLFLNEIFWTIIGIVLAYVLAQRYPALVEKWRATFLILGSIFSFLHIIPFMLWFD
jgi:hypothetical protein